MDSQEQHRLLGEGRRERLVSVQLSECSTKQYRHILHYCSDSVRQVVSKAYTWIKKVKQEDPEE
jgi:hypothetical protein